MRYAVIILALLILVVGGFAPPVVADAGADTAAGLAAPAAQTAQLGQDDSAQTTIVVNVHSDTNATWKVRTRHSLRSSEDVRAFERLVDELQRGEANSSLDEGMFRNYAELAAESTGREMEIVDVSYNGTVTDDGTTGVLTMSFTWTNFAERTDDGGLRVGDAFTTPDGGTWFPWLAEGQQLVIETPESHEVQNSFSGIREGSVVATGPMDLREQPIYVVYEATPGPEPPDPLSLELVAGVGAMLLLVVAGVLYLRQQEETVPQSDTGPASGSVVDRSPDDLDGDDPDSGDSDGGDDVDLSLLSDEERVEYLLEQRGGRMRQADIVKQTGWSDAKVSQLLSAMADEERVNKLRIGRENLISLPNESHRTNGDE
ncbi:hypothetical protein SAMN04487948_103161 [Halogranum amylolyticum]|uniref:IclR helix-turn-helix domain-containing protein n=1 Tax=Halogranum amylolyticum TaxID=660520 RepID=A0A1H8QJY8_9EURY|nr:hypothetical protein [Halogranum amylolyticum]SEO54502.1 hypothetical protein SAMN04487948_103161 [Halogranum amylolyticum]